MRRSRADLSNLSRRVWTTDAHLGVNALSSCVGSLDGETCWSRNDRRCSPDSLVALPHSPWPRDASICCGRMNNELPWFPSRQFGYSARIAEKIEHCSG
jgi:hypothetical protein